MIVTSTCAEQSTSEHEVPSLAGGHWDGTVRVPVRS